MPRRPKNPQVGYMLTGFEVVRFCLEDASALPTQFEMQFNAEMKYFVNVELNMLNVRASIRMSQRDAENALVQLVSQAAFSVAGLEHYVKDGQMTPPTDFIQNVANVTVSTSRGVLIEKLAATKFASLVLPLFNTQDLMPQGAWTVPAKEQMALTQ